MTDVVTSTSGIHQEDHTDDSSQDADSATDMPRSENDGGNGVGQGDLTDRNPEPSAELLEERILDAGNIGGTMFSKHWLFSTLMKLIQVLAGLPGFARDSRSIIMSICVFHFYIIYFHFFSADHGIPQTFDYILTT